MTYLTPEEVKEIVHVATMHIRLFLGNSNPQDFSGDAKDAIVAFHQNPGDFTEEELLRKGADINDAHTYLVRIELRGISPHPLRGLFHGGAAQVSAKGIWGEHRQKAQAAVIKDLHRHHDALTVCVAGSSTLEFTRTGVNKSLPINYLRVCWEEILTAAGYKPGPVIDSRQSRIVIAADGDGTMYEGPKTSHLPLLKDSPAFGPLLQYLKAGGLFMLISGNDLNRTCRRLMEGLPQEVYSRLLICANGGADLVYIDQQGKPVFMRQYRQKALEAITQKAQNPVLDIVYLGDDESVGGNDYAAFQAVGKERGVCVQSLEETKSFLEKWLYERKIGAA